MTTDNLTFESALQLIKSGQPVHTVASQLLTSLTTKEKLSMLTGPMSFWHGLKGLMRGSMNEAPYLFAQNDRLGIPGVKFCDGPRGVVLRKATCFPVAMARGATWDVELERRVGAVMAAEARAFGANMSGSVCINLPRHPAWGRIQETYGEDPILLGEFGVALTKSLQGMGVIACVKHFALNSMEDTRFKVDVKIDDDALHEVYLAHFEMVVKEGNVWSLMSAYNAMNGEWCGQNDVLLNKILRDEWGFKYFVISDWVFGLRDSVKSLKAGLDLEAPFAQIRWKLQQELDSGKITMGEVEKSVTRILAAQLELFSRRTTPDPDTSVVLSQQHRDLAREVAARAMVLLKNEPIPPTGQDATSSQPLLPIDPTKIKSCAMIGALADAMNTGDWGSSYVTSPHVISPYEGFKSALSAHGGTVTLSNTDDITKAQEAAGKTDFAIVVVGYGARDEGENLNASTPMSLIPFPSLNELIFDVPAVLWQQAKERLGLVKQGGPSLGGKAGGDRRSLRLSSKNVDLIRAVRKVNPRTIVAIVASGAVIMEEWIDEVDTVLMNWYSGCEGGDALADVVFGRVDASGRLPFSIPKDEKDLPSFDATATSVVYDKWFGQRLLDRNGVAARFPLGYGCSYTKFSMSDLHVEQRDDILQVEVNVSNIGSRAGRHIVQVYGLPQDAGTDFPTRVLLGFAAVDIQPGQSTRAHVTAKTRPLQRWQNTGWVFASKAVVVEVGSYAGDRAVHALIDLK